MKRIKIRKIILAMMTLGCGLAPAAQQVDLASDDHRPNIVWIVCEDMSLHLSSFGEKTIQTPNLDQLAKDGIRFTQTYTIAGVCAPSRAGLMTGMYPTAIGADNMRTLGAAPGAQPDHVPPPYSVVLPPYVKGYPEFLREAGYYCTNNAKEDYQFVSPVTLWDESGKNAHWRNRPPHRPFFSIFNLGITHEAQIWERDGEPLLVNPASVTVPPYYPDIPEARYAIARNLTNVIKMDQQAGAIIRQLKDDGLYDSTIIFFYSDHGDGLPYVKREILERGLHIPLIVKLPGARGAGTVNREMISGIDLPATLLSLAGVEIPAYMHGQAFLGTQRNRQSRKYVFAGRDRMDSEVDRVRTVLDTSFQYVRNYMPEKAYYQEIAYRLQMPLMKRMIGMRDSGLLKSDAMVWFRKTKPVEELYDLENDPHELHNLAADQRYKKKLAEMRRIYDQWYEAVGDMSVMPEKQILQQIMWQGGDKQPVTAVPEITPLQEGVLIKCLTSGASIGYKINAAEDEINSTSDWEVYLNQPIPLQKGDKLTVKAQRIGYAPSTVTYTFK